MPQRCAARALGLSGQEPFERAYKASAKKCGVRAGSINPNVFQDQEYKHGSLANERPEVRQRALDHILESVSLAKQLGCRDPAPGWPTDSNYPGTANIRHRKQWIAEAFRKVHEALGPSQRLTGGVQAL